MVLEESDGRSRLKSISEKDLVDNVKRLIDIENSSHCFGGDHRLDGAIVFAKRLRSRLDLSSRNLERIFAKC